MRPGTPAPFVVGCGRSGTTLLRLMLNANPQLAVPPESHFLRSVARRPRSYTPMSLVEHALRSERFPDWDLEERGVWEAFDRARPRTLAEAIDVLYSCFAEANGKARWGDKTPPYVMLVEQLARLLPDARFIHLIRDGRDVALSFSSVSFGPRNDPVAQAIFWRNRVIAGRRAGVSLGKERYLELRYEDLVARPEDELRRVCAFVDLAFDPMMLRYHETARRSIPGSRKEFHANVDKPLTADLRDWRTRMTTSDVAWFEAIAADLLTALGYELSGSVRPRGSWLRIRASQARSNLGAAKVALLSRGTRAM
jgi:hypothetical protein